MDRCHTSGLPRHGVDLFVQRVAGVASHPLRVDFPSLGELLKLLPEVKIEDRLSVSPPPPRLTEVHLPFSSGAHVEDELTAARDLARDTRISHGIRNLAGHAGHPRETIGGVVVHRADKRDITFRVYTQGAPQAQ
jgi:hypothetical protein